MFCGLYIYSMSMTTKSRFYVMTTIGSIGIGLFVLILVWCLALLLFVVGVKLQSNIAWIALATATSLTVICLVIPLEKKGSLDLHYSTQDVKDYLIVYKNLFLSLIVLSALLAFSGFFVLHCIEPVRPKPLKAFR